jgi:hypothetical protein
LRIATDGLAETNEDQRNEACEQHTIDRQPPAAEHAVVGA